MKYKDLPKFDSLIRLIQVSFSTPKKNLDMYRLYVALKEHVLYVDNEKNKLMRFYGTDSGNGTITITGENVKKYTDDWNAILDMDIEAEIPKISITEADFDDNNCTYPQDKTMWPSGADIVTIIEFCNKLNDEKTGV